MGINLMPQEYREIILEIMEFTGLEEREVINRFLKEALNRGFNVTMESKKFGIIPHHYDENMEILYKEGVGFIFETTVESLRCGKRLVVEKTVERINMFLRNTNIDKKDCKILMFGDGSASDTIFLFKRGFTNIYYFDIPGSRTYEFARFRLFKRNIKVKFITSVEELKHNYDEFFNVIICFEVLEHLENPKDCISLVSSILKPQGIALITESFCAIAEEFPTHLMSNFKYCGLTPFLFLKSDLILSWYNKNPLYRPMEFVKKKATIKDLFRLLRDNCIVKDLLKAMVRNFWRKVK